MEEIGSIIKSLLLTSKEGILVDHLNRDYKSMNDENIPFRKFGYSNIADFLRALPNILIVQKNGQYYAQPVIDSKNMHIASMVAKQKNPKPKPSSRRPHNTYSGNYKRSSSASRYSSNQRSNFSTNRYGRSQSMQRMSNDSNRNWNSSSHSRPENTNRPQSFGASNGIQTRPEEKFSMPKSQNGYQQIQSSVSLPPPKKLETDRALIRPSNGFQQNPPSSSSTSPPMSHRVSSLHNFSMGKNSQAQNFTTQPIRQNSSGNIPPLISPDHRSLVSPTNSTNNSFKQTTLSSNYSNNTNGSAVNDLALLKPQLKPLSERLKNPLAFSSTLPAVESKTEQNQTPDKKVTFAPTVEIKTNVSPVIRQPPLTPPATPPTPSKTFTDPRDELTDLAFKMNLPPPVYSFTEGGKPKTIWSKITIGEMKYGSYPADARNKEDADKIAAEQALADLKTRYNSQVELSTTYDKQVIKQRVIDIVLDENHIGGIFKHKLPLFYQEKYKETLPSNWDNVIDECSNKIIYENVHGGTILLPYNPSIDIDVPMPELILPKEELWPVYITNLINTEEVYGIILEDEYCTRRDEMTDKIEAAYSKSFTRAGRVQTKKHYAVKKDNTWHRVCVDFIDTENQVADVFFIDTGDYESVYLNELCVLEKGFYELAPQAVRFSIAGYEDLSSYDMINKIGVELLTNLSCYVQVMNREKTEFGMLINAVFYDTSTEDDININDLILEKLTTVPSSPKLATEGEVLEVYLSHVDEITGGIFIQVNNDSFQVLNALIEKLKPEINEETRKRAVVDWNRVTRDAVYLISLPEGQMVRVKIIEQPQGDLLNALLIDIGKTMIIKASELIKIQMIPGAADNNLKLVASVVEKYPVQTCGIQLHNTRTKVLNDKRILKPLREMAPPNIILFCKVIKETNNSSAAVVELFKRGGESNQCALISINNTLIHQFNNPEDEDKNNNLKPKSRLDRKNSRGNLAQKGLDALGKPKVPEIGEYFDVHVTQTVTGPNHFVVQPYHGTEALTILEEKLKVYCETNKNFVKNEEFGKVDSLCAAKVDNKWQRAMVAGNALDESSKMVYTCDSGIMKPVDNSELKPLADEFLTIPYQGIKAKLYDHEKFDWKLQHDNKFKELVVGKDFVSVVRKIEPDSNTKTKQIITLELIDTSGSEDKNILNEIMKLPI